MISAREIYVACTVLCGNIADKVAPDGVVAAITSTDISNYVILGITLGGWVSIALMITAFVLMIFNIIKLIRYIKEAKKEWDTGSELTKNSS